MGLDHYDLNGNETKLNGSYRKTNNIAFYLNIILGQD